MFTLSFTKTTFVQLVQQVQHSSCSLLPFNLSNKDNTNLPLTLPLVLWISSLKSCDDYNERTTILQDGLLFLPYSFLQLLVLQLGFLVLQIATLILECPLRSIVGFVVAFVVDYVQCGLCNNVWPYFPHPMMLSLLQLL